MGASVSVYWPDISGDQIENQPPFFNDCKAWGDWMAEREQNPDVLDSMRSLGVEALCTFKTDGVDDDDVEWVTPADLEAAASRLRTLVLAKDPCTARIVETYANSANGVDPPGEELARDLADVVEMAQFAKAEGVSRMTLEVNW